MDELVLLWLQLPVIISKMPVIVCMSVCVNVSPQKGWWISPCASYFIGRCVCVSPRPTPDKSCWTCRDLLCVEPGYFWTVVTARQRTFKLPFQNQNILFFFYYYYYSSGLGYWIVCLPPDFHLSIHSVELCIKCFCSRCWQWKKRPGGFMETPAGK